MVGITTFICASLSFDRVPCTGNTTEIENAVFGGKVSKMANKISVGRAVVMRA